MQVDGWDLAMWGLVLVLVVPLVGWAGRAWVRRRLRQSVWHRLGSVLPGAPAGVGRGVDGALVVAGGATTLDVLYHLSLLDPAVLDALDRAGGVGPLGTYPALVAHLQSVAGRGEAAWEGLVHHTKGLAGERVLAEQLRDLGHTVELAASPTQAGWDALVDGAPVQFKVGSDPGAIAEHFARYPDIPVITVADHAQVAGQVLALEPTSAAVEASTRSTLDGLLGVQEVGFAFPVVAASFSAVRHGWRVFRGSIRPARALAHTALDTAGVGGGGQLGAKIGAAGGGLVAGPVGAGLGGIAGGLAGAYGGRRVAERIKARGLRAARAELDAAMGAWPDAYAQALDRKAEVLEARARAVRPVGRSWSVGGWVREAIAARHARQGRACRSWAVRLRQALRDAPDRAALARSWQGMEGCPRAFSAALDGLGQRVEAANRVIAAEERALGRA